MLRQFVFSIKNIEIQLQNKNNLPVLCFLNIYKYFVRSRMIHLKHENREKVIDYLLLHMDGPEKLKPWLEENIRERWRNH